MSTDTKPCPTIELGVVVKPHGVKGLVKVHLHNRGSRTLHGCDEMTLDQGGQRRQVGFTIVSDSAKGLLLRVDGVDDMDQAEDLRGAVILVGRDTLEPTEPGEYLYVDLLGCEVLDEAGEALGTVSEVFEAGASDVLVVRQGEQERLIPLVEEWIQEVDLEARIIRVLGSENWEAYRIK